MTSYHPKDIEHGYCGNCHDFTSAPAGAAIEAAVAAERERIYDELGHDHFVIFTEDRWTVEHSVECRLSGHMHECDHHAAIVRIAAEFDEDMAGRWRIDEIDSEGLPALIRADANSQPG